MSDPCAGLIDHLQLVKGARNQALTDNADAKNAGRLPVYSDADIAQLRQAVDDAARAARDAGCDLDGIAG